MAPHTDVPTTPRQAITPVGINHLVLNVRNLEESHAFWTEIMGFKQVGSCAPVPTGRSLPKCAFTVATIAAR